jgi:hypothetical protein
MVKQRGFLFGTEYDDESPTGRAGRFCGRWIVWIAAIVIAVLAIVCLSRYDGAQAFMMRPGAYGHGPFHWGSGRYWGGWSGWNPGPRYYNYGAYRWNGFNRWRY